MWPWTTLLSQKRNQTLNIFAGLTWISIFLIVRLERREAYEGYQYITHILTVAEANRDLTSEYFSTETGMYRTTGKAEISARNKMGKRGIRFSNQTPQNP